MRKIIATFLTVLLVFSIFPLSTFADDDVLDIATFPEWKVYSYGGAGAVLSTRNYDYADIFVNKTWINSSGIDSTIAVDFGAAGLLMENLTVGPGIAFEIRPPHGAPVTIKNCTFKGGTKNHEDDYLYMLTILGGHVTLTDNIFDGVYRGVNHRPSVSVGSYSLTATGNHFNLLPIEEQPEDNVGIQLSGARNLPWPADSVNVNNNTFENASIALRLHSGFRPVEGLGDENVISFTNNYMRDTLEGVGIHPEASPDDLEILQGFLDNNVEQADNEFDNCFPFEWNGPVHFLFNIRGFVEWVQCSITRLVNFFRNMF